jgi:hypothetical protein
MTAISSMKTVAASAVISAQPIFSTPRTVWGRVGVVTSGAVGTFPSDSDKSN